MDGITGLLPEGDPLLLPEELDVPEIVRREHDACLRAFLQGRREDSYRHIGTILRHYHDLSESLPEPCGHLYFSLLIKEVSQEDPAAQMLPN